MKFANIFKLLIFNCITAFIHLLKFFQFIIQPSMTQVQHEQLINYLEDQQYEMVQCYLQKININSLCFRNKYMILALAKCLFALQQYNLAIDQIRLIRDKADDMLYYQAEMIKFKSQYFLGRASIQTLQLMEQHLKTTRYGKQHIKLIESIRVMFKFYQKKQQSPQLLKQQGQIFKVLMKEQSIEPLQEGMPMFIVPQKWLRQYEIYTYQTSQRNQNPKHPGPITQFEITDHKYYIYIDDNPRSTYTNHYLLKHAKFKCVTKKIWMFLQYKYGGIQIKRWNISVNDNGQNPITEVFMKQINIIKQMQNHRDTMLISVQISKKQNWKGLKKKIQPKFGYNGHFVQLKDDQKITVDNNLVLEQCDTTDKIYIYTQQNIQGQMKARVPEKQHVKNECGYCGSPKKLKWCHCKTIKYCNMECLMAHRKKHIQKCQLEMSHIRMKSKIWDTFDLQETTFSGKKGLVGLRNLGNTCYMNSGLQCLLNTKQLTQFFMSNKFVQDINFNNPLGTGGYLACAYAELVRKVWGGNEKVISPFVIKKMMSKVAAQFSGFGQQDSQEFISYLIDGLQQDLNLVMNKQNFETRDQVIPDEQASRESEENFAKRIKSKIRDLMVGQYKSTVICQVCNKISVCFDPFLLLSIPIPSFQQNSVYFVPEMASEPVQRFSFIMKGHSTLQHLKRAIGNYLKKSTILNRLAFKAFSIKKGAFVHEFSSEDQKSKLTDVFFKHKSSVIFLYQVPQHTAKSTIFRLQYYYKKSCVGFPRFLRIPDSIQDEKKIALIASTIKRFVGEQDPQVFFENAPERQNNIIRISLNRDLQLLRYTQTKDFKFPSQQSSEIFSLQDCIEAFSHPQTLQKQNQWYCNRCKTFRPAQKQMQVYKANKILVLAFKRFNRFRKVRVPIRYHLQGFNIGPFLKSNKANEPILYDLYGVVNHYGSLGGGHYTAFCHNFLTGKWYQFNDNHVRQVLKREVVHEDAYVLFYRRRE